MSHLRYIPGHRYDLMFNGLLRYPVRREVTREQAEHMRQAMPDPDAWQIVEED